MPDQAHEAFVDFALPLPESELFLSQMTNFAIPLLVDSNKPVILFAVLNLGAVSQAQSVPGETGMAHSIVNMECNAISVTDNQIARHDEAPDDAACRAQYHMAQGTCPYPYSAGPEGVASVPC